MTRDDLERLDPEIRDALALQAIRYFRVFGEPGSPGSRRALFDICKVAIRQAKRDDVLIQIQPLEG